MGMCIKSSSEAQPNSVDSEVAAQDKAKDEMNESGWKYRAKRFVVCYRRIDPMQVFVIVLLALWVGISNAQQLRPQDIYKSAVTSVATLQVKTKDGRQYTGSAFMAIKEGLAVTAWHVVKDASMVVAKFSNGEEFEVSGLVDKDEKRDVAIIRVKAFGRPALPLNTDDPEIGSKVYAIGAPKGLGFTLSDGLASQIQTVDGVKQIQFSCPASSGNSGGPLVNSRGEVIGIVSWQIREGQNLNFAVPVMFAKGLDLSLPTQPWEAVKSVALVSMGQTPDDEFDKKLAECMLMVTDLETACSMTYEQIAEDGGFREGVPPDLYALKETLVERSKELAGLTSGDSQREKFKEVLQRQMAKKIEAADLVADAIHAAQVRRGWDAHVSGLYSRSLAGNRMGDDGPTFKEAWEKVSSSQTFIAAFPEEEKYRWGLLPDSAGFTLGVDTFVGNSLKLVVVPKGSVAYEMGFRAGDMIVAVNGKRVVTLQEMKVMMARSGGNGIRVHVKRYDASESRWADEYLDVDVPEGLATNQ